jgi:hypothetical protein
MTFKSLKKYTAVFLCFLCVICSAAVCGAVSNEYQVSAIDDMSITLPDSMSAVTRDSKESDKYFSVFGLDYNTTMQNFKNSDIYLQGMNEATTLTLTVTMTTTDESKGINNYNLLDSEKLGEVVGNFLTQNEYSACTPDQSEDSKIVWLYIDASIAANGSQIKTYQAHTVYDGMSINVTLQRNGSNLTADDYRVFTEIVKSVSFGSDGFVSKIIPIIVIGGFVILIILLIILVIAVKRGKRKSKRNKNDKILSELADKYNLNEEKKKSKSSKKKSEPKPEPEPELEPQSQQAQDDEFKYIIIPEEDNANKEGSDYIDSEMFEDSLEEQFKQDYLQSDPEDVKIYDRNRPSRVVSDEEIDEIINSARTFELDPENVVYSDEPKYEPEQPQTVQAQPEEFEQEPEQIVEEELAEETSDETSEEIAEEITDDSGFEQEEFNNDEVLVREQAKRTKFADSDDFFDEAPTKVRGIISNEELDAAEDYDVISEIEKRAEKVRRTEVEKPDVDEGKPIGEIFAGIGSGIKSFGIHFGYFCTNLSRMIKRKRAASKRQKAEQQRRERERQRAQRQRRQQRAAQDGSLVQVHKRSDRRPPSNRR